MTKVFAQEENFWNYEFRIFNMMIKHRNNKAKVFTVMNTPISHSLGGNQPLPSYYSRRKRESYHLGYIYVDLMNLSEQKEVLGFRIKNKM